MANRVKSNNVIIEMDISGTYYPFFCGKTMEYSQNQDLIEVTSVNSTVAREYEAGLTTASLNITGVTILDNTDNRIAVTYLMQQGVRRVAQSMRIRLTDDDGDAIQILFEALITNNTLSRAFGTYSQSSVSMTVTGEPTISAIVVPPGIVCPETPLYIDGVAGEISVADALLTNTGVEILMVARNGLQFDETNGTPGNRQFKFTALTGTITFDANLPFMAGEVVYILYKDT